MIYIDGVGYDLFVDIDRKVELSASNLSGLLLNKRYYNDVYGTYMQYALKVAIPVSEKEMYDEFFENLSDPVGEHTFVFPHGQETITIVGRLSGIADVYVRMPGGGQVWKGLKFNVTANHPSKQLSYGQILHRGITPMPDFAIGELDREDFIRAVYELILGREPDEDGMAAWLAALENGWTPAYILRKIATSDEARATEVAVRKRLITIAYYELLDRLPSNSEVRTWDETDLSVDAIIDKIKRSEEYQQSGTSTSESEIRGQLIKMAYWDLLDRKPSAAEVETWESTDLSVDAIVEKIIKSDEYKAKHGQDDASILAGVRRQLIKAAYQDIFDRTASDDEAVTWEVTGLSVDAIIKKLMSSNEALQDIRVDLIGMLFPLLLGRDARSSEVDTWNETGLRLEQIADKIIKSEEYEQSGTGRIAHDVRVEMIKRLYELILGREGRDSELFTWDETELTVEQIAVNLMSSEEYEAQATGKSKHEIRLDLIAALYGILLEREGSESEIASWDATGLTLDRIAEKIMKSSEYRGEL